jgi:nucleoside-diphosphate-sugar epimerase
MESVLQRFYRNKQVLVTGGAGFIGSHLVEKLVSLGARVTVLDNFSTGSLKNLKSVVSCINLIYADIRAPHSCLKATSNQAVVFHLAAFVSVPESIMFPENCLQVNSLGTKNILLAAAKNNVTNVVISSSSAVYGNKAGICSEDDDLAPLSPYATSKHEAEEWGKKIAEKSAINVVSLRYFNVYGERQNPHGSYAAVVARFTHLLNNKLPLTIFGDGTQTRDFVPVAQAVEANLIAGMTPDAKGTAFNIGSGKSITLLTLIKQLEKELKTSATGINFLPARMGDILHSEASCKKFSLFAHNLVGLTEKAW